MTPPGQLRLAPGVGIEPARIQWSQVRSGGPGGQHVNTTSSQVELRLAVTDLVGLSPAAAARLAMLASHLLTDAGELILTCADTRSALRNRDLALERLCALVVDACAVPKPRKKTKPSRAAKRRRLEAKSQRSDLKTERKAKE
jgi:ribosome-associated protein